MTKKKILFSSRFIPVFITQFLGAMNDNVFKNAFVMLVLYHLSTNTGPQAKFYVTIAGGVFILPFFLFSAVAAQLTNKFNMDKVAVAVKGFEIVIALIGTVGFYTSNVLLLLFCLFLFGLHSSLFGPLKYSIIPKILDNSEILDGNAYIEMGTFVAILLGTIVGGVSMGMENGKIISPIIVLVLAVFGFISSLFIKKIKAQNLNEKISLNILSATRSVFKAVEGKPDLKVSILAISWFWFLGAVLMSMFPIFVKDFLGGNEGVVTFVLSLFTLGVAVGSLLCSWISQHRLELGMVPIGAFGMTVCLLDLFFSVKNLNYVGELRGVLTIINDSQALRCFVDLIGLSLFSGLFTVPLYTSLQTFADDESRSSVIATNNISNAFFMVSSAIMLMILFKYNVAISYIFLLLAVLNTIVAIIMGIKSPELGLRLFCYVLTHIVYKFSVSGKKNIPASGPAVLICNHLSFIDWLFVLSSSKRPVRFIMHYSFMDIPVAKYIFRGVKIIPIAGAREDEKIMEDAFIKIKDALDSGELVCIFPEGKITHDGKLCSFKPGLKRIIQETPVPVIPMVIKGQWGSFFSRKYGSACSNYKALLTEFRRPVHLKIGHAVNDPDCRIDELEKLTQEMLRN